MTEPYRGDEPDVPTCARCNVALEPIFVIDHRENGMKHVGLAYLNEQWPESSVWTGKLKNAAGVVHAHRCPRCNLVAWYANPGAPPGYT